MNSNMKLILVVMVMATLLLIAGCSSKSELDPAIAGEGITIFKSASCGCCGVFSSYMGGKGYNVNVQTTDEMSMIKQRYNIPVNLQSCHTTVVGDYFVEGHIPSQAFEKLLTEKPDIAGIAMPGMPSGSPGMPGAKQGEWIIHAVHKDGSVTEFMRI